MPSCRLPFVSQYLKQCTPCTGDRLFVHPGRQPQMNRLQPAQNQVGFVASQLGHSIVERANGRKFLKLAIISLVQRQDLCPSWTAVRMSTKHIQNATHLSGLSSRDVCTYYGQPDLNYSMQANPAKIESSFRVQYSHHSSHSNGPPFAVFLLIVSSNPSILDTIAYGLCFCSPQSAQGRCRSVHGKLVAGSYGKRAHLPP